MKELLSYLMGLYRYKCGTQEVKAAVYMCDEKEIVLWTNLTKFDNFISDVTAEIPVEAEEAHNEFYESKRWHEHGCFDPETGIVRDNRCINWSTSTVRDDFPPEDDPGE